MARRSVHALLVALVAIAVLRVRAAPDGARGFTFPDAYHYADIGRQIARGDGMTTLQTYPYVLAWLRETGLPTAPPWPNVTRFPLLPLMYGPSVVVNSWKLTNLEVNPLGVPNFGGADL